MSADPGSNSSFQICDQYDVVGFPDFFGKVTNKYEIQGRLDVRKVRVDPCQARADAVNAAQAVVKTIKDEINRTRDEPPRVDQDQQL